MNARGRVTERSLYPAIQKIFKEHGARSVPEEKRVTAPDFIVEWLGERWIVSIKIGDPTRPRLLKEAFIQFISHVRDFKIDYGMIIFYPEEIREIEPSEETIENVVRTADAYFIVLKPQIELRKPLPSALDEIERIIRDKIPVSLSLKTVTSILRAHIEDLMKKVKISQSLKTEVISDPQLFFGINPIKEKKESVLTKISTFLATYIFFSQALFLRLYVESYPLLIEEIDLKKIAREDVKKLFEKVREINYRPIFEIDVLNLIPEELIQDTFKLLFGLDIRNIRYELPGRLFHELMPKGIRKLMAAFYTRPIAAYILAQLTIDKADATVYDPACGSGTILTMAYRRKLELWKQCKNLDNPHKIFCEKQIYGCDIMPFAVHLTNANLIAMDPTPIEYTQIILGDSLKLVPYKKVKPGYRSLMEFIPGLKNHIDTVKANAFKSTGEPIDITLSPVDVILMNPPFTKVERGVKKYIDTRAFEEKVGREVGLWGHFIALADVFLKENGMFGAVIPINVLRGRESREAREIIFKQWLPLYVIKPSINYGFSEYAEYRDILVIAKKTREKPQDHKVKFCIIKEDLNKLTESEAKWIAEQIKQVTFLRSKLLDIDSYPLSDVLRSSDNLMPFISGPSFEAKDALKRVIDEAKRLFQPFPEEYFAEGYAPRPKGSSRFMFITRPINMGRLKESFLILKEVQEDKIIARTSIGTQEFEFNKNHFLPSLRTPVGLDKMDVTSLCDYVAKEPYEDIDKVIELSGFKKKLQANYWNIYVKNEFKRSRGCYAIIRRINPYSPNQMLTAYYSSEPLILSDLFHVIKESDEKKGKAVVTLLNSIFFLAYFFNMKEETTGRYTELRQHDLEKMVLYPTQGQIDRLVNVFDKYKDKAFPPLREQLDIHFNDRYKWFWEQKKGKSKKLIQSSLPPVKPHTLRLDFDMAVLTAVGANLTVKDLLQAYEAIVWDMIVTRGLKRD